MRNLSEFWSFCSERRLTIDFDAMNMQAMAIGQLWEVWAGFLTVGVFGHEYELD